MTQAPDQAATRTIRTTPSADVLRRLAALQTALTPELRLLWNELFGTEAPRFNRRYLQDRLGYRLQELAFGALRTTTVARLEAMGARLDRGSITLRRIRADDRPTAGTRLIREYQGFEYTVTVLQNGFEFEGRHYKSLSAIARSITHTRWNGWVFFGLRGRGGP